MQFLNDWAYRDRNGYLHVIGVVKNGTTKGVKQVKVSATLIDSKGTQVARRTSPSYLSLLNPGQESPFDIVFQGVAGELPQYQLELSWEVASVAQKTKMQIRQTMGALDESGYYWVKGEIVNIGPERADLIAIVGTLYDDAGKIAGIAFGLPDVAPLPVGASSPFSLAVDLPKGVTVKNLVVQAEAY